MNPGPQESRTSVIQCPTGIQGPRDPGPQGSRPQGSRASGIQGLRDPGPRDPGTQGSRPQGSRTSRIQGPRVPDPKIPGPKKAWRFKGPWIEDRGFRTPRAPGFKGPRTFALGLNIDNLLLRRPKNLAPTAFDDIGLTYKER